MRRQNPQLSLYCSGIEHDHAKELALIDRILEDNPCIKELVEQDLFRGLSSPETGAPGMTGDQVLRALIIKQMNGFSYDELSFHLADSVSYRTLCGYGAFERTPSRSTLADNIKRVRQETLTRINRLLVAYARKKGIETGRKVRIDCTVVETNIHYPTDSRLLFDMCVDYVEGARDLMLTSMDITEPVRELIGELSHYLDLVKRVIDQTERRVFKGQKVPAEEKVVSLFESHTDVITKKRRETLFGHKVYLTGGASGLILDCLLVRGNPADTSLAIPMLRRQASIYGRRPRQASLDGGFASKENLVAGKALGVEDLCFSKKRGLEIADMVKSTWVYKKLRDFRAGVEGMISFLKRAFGMDRCTCRTCMVYGH